MRWVLSLRKTAGPTLKPTTGGLVRKYPEILDETIERSIVVVGLPRTGTTMLHRTIATDTSLLAISLGELDSLCRLLMILLADERIGISEAEVAAMLEAAPELAAIHPMDARAPDEEIMLLEHSFMSTVPECYAHIPQFGDWFTNKTSPQVTTIFTSAFCSAVAKAQKRTNRDALSLKTPHHLHYLSICLNVSPTLLWCRHTATPSMSSLRQHDTALAQPFTTPECTGTGTGLGKGPGSTKTMDYRAAHPEAPYLDLYFTDTVANPEQKFGNL